MSRDSIFNPDGNQTEHSGSTFMGPRADNNSQMPPDVVDGQVGPDESSDLDKLAQTADESPAQRLEDFAQGNTDPDATPDAQR
jgi:hypothetical protein